MRSVSLRLVDLERKPLIPLGFEGENEYMTINFDCKTVFDKHPAAVPTLAVTPPQGDSYPAVVVRDGDIVSWTVCDSDLVCPGEGVLQLTFVDGTIIGKTYKARTKVLDSITPSGEAPTPIQNWLIQAAAALQALPQEVSNAVVALMGAMVGVGETLDPDENVTVSYDAENNTLTIGVPKGKDGTDGNTPTITATKSGKVTTIYSDGVAIATINDGEDGTEIIDDTTVSSESTWSSQKIDDSKADKANPEFTGSINLGRKSGSTVGANSIAVGQGLVADSKNQAVFGQYNKVDEIPAWAANTHYYVGDIVYNTVMGKKLCSRCITENTDSSFDSNKWENYGPQNINSKYAFAVGGGTAATQGEKNIFDIDWNGNGEFTGDLTINKGKENEVSVSSLKTGINSKMDEPSSEGTAGQFLQTDGNGGRTWATPSGGGGTSDYSDLTNKPQINGITLSGNKTSADLGIGVVETVSGPTPSITGVADHRYICGECSTLSITAPASGIIDVVFESGSTPTVLTVSSAKTGVTAIKWANGFDPTALEANTTYEINILDGEFGVVGSWT